MSNIAKQIESVNKLHGGEREQGTRYANFVAWQIAQRQKAHGDEASPILKKAETA